MGSETAIHRLHDGGGGGSAASRAAFLLAILAHPTRVAVTLSDASPSDTLRFAVRVRTTFGGGGAALGTVGAAATHTMLVHPDGVGIALTHRGPLTALAVTVGSALIEAVLNGAGTADFTASVGTVLEHVARVTVFGILAVAAKCCETGCISPRYCRSTGGEES